MDKLEKYIQKNRSAFDADRPSPKVWERLDEKLHEKPVRLVPVSRVWWVAASLSTVIVGLLAVLLLGTETQEAATSPPTLAAFSPELAEAESYYEMVIHRKQTSLQAYDLQRLDWPSDPQADLRELRSEYEELKTTLFQTGNPQPVMAAMIENLRARMQLLSRELELLEKYERQIEKTKNTEYDEKAS